MHKLSLLAALLLVLTVGATVSGDLASSALQTPLVGKIPPRSQGAPTGTEILQSTADMPLAARDKALLEQLEAGNVPLLLRQLESVELSGESAMGRGPTVTIWVMPDYLAVGSDEDYVRVPLSLHSATSVARRFGFILPTCKIVNAIYARSELRLGPQTMKPGPQMTSNAYFQEHNRRIDEQLEGHPLDLLIAGHKKDLVLTNRLAKKPGKVAIYGWHRLDGRPIQPLSTLHHAGYADYSHGVRLVSATVLIDGEPRSIYEVLEDPQLADLLSDEGAIPEARRLMGL